MHRRLGTLGMVALLASCATGHASTNITRNNARTGDTRVATTTTTFEMVRQPGVVSLPAPPTVGIGLGNRGAAVLAYERRLRQLHFDPGPVDGVFSPDTAYAVVTVEKLLGLQRDGVIGPQVQAGLEHFTYRPALPKAEGDRVEINLDTQVLMVYRHWQPVLLTTTSTGSGAYFCGGNDGCQYAITPTGHFHFEYLREGWDEGKLGRMWNPYYFNGGIAIHGLQSVPTYPASHGCARIPMDIANYFPTLVATGESVYVLGTPMKPGSLYVGPTTTTSTATTTTTVARTTTPTTRSTSTTVPRRPPTSTHPTPTTAPRTTTTRHK